MKPALTAEWMANDPHGANVEWMANRNGTIVWRGEWAANCIQEGFTSGIGQWVVTPERVALWATLQANKGQPFDFTREDVQMLRTMAGELVHAADDYPEVVAAYPNDFAERMTSVADRIEALLPPETIASNETKA